MQSHLKRVISIDFLQEIIEVLWLEMLAKVFMDLADSVIKEQFERMFCSIGSR